MLNNRAFSSSLLDPRFILPGTNPYYNPDRDFKTEHIKLTFSFDMNKHIVYGFSETTLRTIKDQMDFINFNAVDMKIDSVHIKKENRLEKMKFNYDGSILKVLPKKSLKRGDNCTIKVKYRLIDPKLGVFFMKRKDWQIWTHGEAEDARYWFPCYDSPNEKCTTEMILRVPKDYVGLSNGKLVETRIENNNKIFHWKFSSPHSSYLVMFAVGKFSIIEEN